MSLSIATSNLVKSSVTKPEIATSGQPVEVSESGGDSGEASTFSDTLDATLTESKGKASDKAVSTDKASMDKAASIDQAASADKTVSADKSLSTDNSAAEKSVTEKAAKQGDAEMNPQPTAKAVVSAQGDDGELPFSDESLDVKTDSSANIDKHSASHAAHSQSSSAVSGDESATPATTQADTSKLSANKTLSDSAELLARLDQSNKALKPNPNQSLSNDFKISAVTAHSTQALTGDETGIHPSKPLSSQTDDSHESDVKTGDSKMNSATTEQVAKSQGEVVTLSSGKPQQAGLTSSEHGQLTEAGRAATVEQASTLPSGDANPESYKQTNIEQAGLEKVGVEKVGVEKAAVTSDVATQVTNSTSMISGSTAAKEVTHSGFSSDNVLNESGKVVEKSADMTVASNQTTQVDGKEIKAVAAADAVALANGDVELQSTSDSQQVSNGSLIDTSSAQPSTSVTGDESVAQVAPGVLAVGSASVSAELSARLEPSNKAASQQSQVVDDEFADEFKVSAVTAKGAQQLAEGETDVSQTKPLEGKTGAAMTAAVAQNQLDDPASAIQSKSVDLMSPEHVQASKAEHSATADVTQTGQSQAVGQQVAGQYISGEQIVGQQIVGQQISGQQVDGQKIAGQQISAQDITVEKVSKSQSGDGEHVNTAQSKVTSDLDSISAKETALTSRSMDTLADSATAKTTSPALDDEAQARLIAQQGDTVLSAQTEKTPEATEQSGTMVTEQKAAQIEWGSATTTSSTDAETVLPVEQTKQASLAATVVNADNTESGQESKSVGRQSVASLSEDQTQSLQTQPLSGNTAIDSEKFGTESTTSELESADESSLLMASTSAPTTKTSNELQWSPAEPAARTTLSTAGAANALATAQTAVNNAAQAQTTETQPQANSAADARLMNSASQLAELQASAPTSASASAAQSAAFAASAAAAGMGFDSRKQGANEVSDINAASGTTSAQGINQPNMARAEQAQATTPQSPLLLNKENAAEQMNERLQMMMSKNLKHVDIRLDPPELGRMQIRMTLNSDSASVHFTVQNQQTRDMVDQAMPRLREMLSQQGIQLADTSVQQQNSGQQQRHAQQTAQGQGQGSGGQSAGQGDADMGMDEATSVNMAVRNASDGISYYA
ncbi:flagellar hook-length control protein FliK [Vibrio hippocampi]|uniref:Flagellar hook-length control protein-like C-terminal domain-containing protein n=1 Tax=Vibrio hippocampi TaxID=654686 RepID=A0ABN8DDX6_9VIBR|nr:flagellar hook-length control protein FliK [Vibrio hippocampi]CAH0525182.1 hypothetical protein VHP8226_00842 [Vibrio hippocampi]